MYNSFSALQTTTRPLLTTSTPPPQEQPLLTWRIENLMLLVPAVLPIDSIKQEFLWCKGLKFKVVTAGSMWTGCQSSDGLHTRSRTAHHWPSKSTRTRNVTGSICINTIQRKDLSFPSIAWFSAVKNSATTTKKSTCNTFIAYIFIIQMCFHFIKDALKNATLQDRASQLSKCFLLLLLSQPLAVFAEFASQTIWSLHQNFDWF